MMKKDHEQNLCHGNILVVEDDQTNLMLLEELLTMQGYHIQPANDGEIALEHIKTDRPELILLDYNLPGMDGVEVCHHLKADPTTRDIPVIFLSSFTASDFKIKALDAGAIDYVIKPIEYSELLLKIENHLKMYRLQQQLVHQSQKLMSEIEERKQAEKNLCLERDKLKNIFEAMEDGVYIVNEHYDISYANPVLVKDFGQYSGRKCYEYFHAKTKPCSWCKNPEVLQGKTVRWEWHSERNGKTYDLISTPIINDDNSISKLEIFRDITKQKNIEQEKDKLHTQLLHAQKLESVGQLAAGIAHEINTPTQFIGTNIDFMGEAVHDITTFISQLQLICQKAPKSIAEALDTALEDMDWDYLSEELPKAIAQSQDGVKRVTSIVRAMKEFSHPGAKNKGAADLNHIIETTVTIARNEWKYVANVETDFAMDMPKVPCLIDEMGQVILNLLVNGAHAIGKKLGNNPEGEKGTIYIQTSYDEHQAEIQIRDTGNGIAEEVQPRIFDPFFTTKDVGKGTGQGLAIAHDVITNKHNGTLTFTSKIDQGTTFIVTLPLHGESK